VFRLLIQETPVAGAPVQVNTETKITDTNGQFTATLERVSYYTISSGLEAISFTPLYDTGTNFALQSPVPISAGRLISSASDPCRVVVKGYSQLYFSTINLSDHILTVPLEYQGINSIYSQTGQATPPEDFAAGASGFWIPESHFSQGSTLAGVWRFLGQDVQVASDPQFCVDVTVPGGCQPVDATVLAMPFEHTRKVVSKLMAISVASTKRNSWNVSQTATASPFLARSAKAIAMMGRLAKDSSRHNFVCEVTPMSCKATKVSKTALRNAFANIFKGPMPPGLGSQKNLVKKETAAFESVLKKVPVQYSSCQ
jgi:hypothetical protein